MAEEQATSSEQPDSLFSSAAYVQDDAIPHWQDLHRKTDAVKLVQQLYDREGWEFTNWHAALFYMFSGEDLARCLEDPRAARYYGNGAELFASLRTYLLFASTMLSMLTPTSSLVVPGRVPGSDEPAAGPAATPAAAADNQPSAVAPSGSAAGQSDVAHDDGASRGTRKRRFSLTEAAGSLRKKAAKGAGAIADLFKPPSSSDEAGASTSSKKDVKPAVPVEPLDKGKGRMTRSAATALAAQEMRQTGSVEEGESAHPRGFPELVLDPVPSSATPTGKHPRRKLKKVS